MSRPMQQQFAHGGGADVIFRTPNPGHPRDGFFYLATPYSRYPGGLDAAFRMAVHQAGILMRAGVPVFCPIAHTHPIAVTCEMDPLDHGIWMPLDRPFMDAARGLILVLAEGWHDSVGMREEERIFAAARKPITLMKPGILPAEFRS